MLSRSDVTSTGAFWMGYTSYVYRDSSTANRASVTADFFSTLSLHAAAAAAAAAPLSTGVEFSRYPYALSP